MYRIDENIKLQKKEEEGEGEVPNLALNTLCSTRDSSEPTLPLSELPSSVIEFAWVAFLIPDKEDDVASKDYRK